MLAGPGTGKTRVIIERIVHMITVRGIDPSAIVAITFTIKAAEELRVRLAEALNDNRADAVKATTSHAFGRTLVLRFADLLGFAGPPRLIDAPAARRLLRELCATNRLFTWLPSAGRDGVVVEAVRFIGDCRNHTITAATALAHAQEWARRIEAISDPVQAAAQREHQRRFADHARLFDLYERATRERGWIGVDQLITLPIELLTAHPGVAAIVRQEVSALLFDEFQDANRSQIELLRLICPPESPRDFCVVGDDDQSIYRFRGAEDRGFEIVDAVWGAGVRKVRLQDNHRSRGPIVEAARVTIAAAEHRFDRTKTLRVAPEKPDSLHGPHVEFITLDTKQWQRDAEGIAAAILHDQRQATAQGLAPPRLSRTAVIARSNKDAARIARYLELEGIPARLFVREGWMEDTGVRDVLNWARLLTSPAAEHAIVEALVAPPCFMPTARAVALARSVAEERARLRLQGSRLGESSPILEMDDEEPTARSADLINRLKRARTDEPSLTASIDTFLRLHERLSPVAAIVPADQALYEIIAAVGTPECELVPSFLHARRVRALARLMAFAVDHKALLEPPGDLGSLMTYLDDMEPGEEGFAPEEMVDGSPEDDADAPDAVQVLTAHRSKGLQFDTVYVPRVGNHGFMPSAKDRGEPILPRDLLPSHGMSALSAQLLDAAEARRVFYVAITRAERRLVMLGPIPQKIDTSVSCAFFREFREALTAVPPAPSLAGMFQERAIDDLIRACAAGGVILTASASNDPSGVVGGRRAILDQARRLARRDAGAALEAVGGLPSDNADEARARADEALRDAARKMELVAALEAGRADPSWLKTSSEPVKAFAARLRELLERAASGADLEAALIRAPAPPLTLSFSQLDAYLRCPRCYYLRYQLRFPEPDSKAISVGNVCHRALEMFYRSWSRADAEGRPLPGKRELLQIARTAFIEQIPPGVIAQQGQLEATLDLLSRAFDNLHRPEAQVLELEKLVTLPIRHAGHTHRISAKVDRIDLQPGGGYRIIDYKSGSLDSDGVAYKKYREPAADDLQMSIYALAACAMFTPERYSPDAPESSVLPEGEAQYWVLGAVEPGVLPFSKLKLNKVVGKIRGAIDGILAGEFASEPKCEGQCRVLALNG